MELVLFIQQLWQENLKMQHHRQEKRQIDPMPSHVACLLFFLFLYMIPHFGDYQYTFIL